MNWILYLILEAFEYSNLHGEICTTTWKWKLHWALECTTVSMSMVQVIKKSSDYPQTQVIKMRKNIIVTHIVAFCSHVQSMWYTVKHSWCALDILQHLKIHQLPTLFRGISSGSASLRDMISQSTIPYENTSALVSYRWPLSTSGAIQYGVPTTDWFRDKDLRRK